MQGALALIDELAHWLTELTGMPAVAMTPKAGAHGELCGLLAIRAALEARGEKRHAHPRARIRARHQPGDRGALPASSVEDVPATRGRPRRSRRAEARSSAPMSPA